MHQQQYVDWQKKQFSDKKGSTTLVIDSNSSGVKVQYMISLYTNSEAQTIPNRCSADACIWCHDCIIWHRNCWTLDGNHAQSMSEGWNKDKGKAVYTVDEVKAQDLSVNQEEWKRKVERSKKMESKGEQSSKHRPLPKTCCPQHDLKHSLFSCASVGSESSTGSVSSSGTGCKNFFKESSD